MNRPSLLRQAMRPATGATLVVTLLMLVVVLLLGIAASQLALQGERMARNDRDRRLAFQAAEAALRDAELDIEDAPDPRLSRSRLFSRYSAAGFPSADGTCHAGAAHPYLGLCRPSAPGQPFVWQTADMDGDASAFVPYGRFTGRIYPTGDALAAKVPRYLIELLPDRTPGGQAERRAYLYRITAVGYGASEHTQVALQSIYRKTR